MLVRKLRNYSNIKKRMKAFQEILILLLYIIVIAFALNSLYNIFEFFYMRGRRKKKYEQQHGIS